MLQQLIGCWRTDDVTTATVAEAKLLLLLVEQHGIDGNAEAGADRRGGGERNAVDDETEEAEEEEDWTLPPDDDGDGK